VLELVGQRVYALALGYEDLNDHDDLRHDPLLAVLAGKADPSGMDRQLARDRGDHRPKAAAHALANAEPGRTICDTDPTTPCGPSASSRYCRPWLGLRGPLSLSNNYPRTKPVFMKRPTDASLSQLRSYLELQRLMCGSPIYPPHQTPHAQPLVHNWRATPELRYPVIIYTIYSRLGHATILDDLS
jgi:hypothetical protein